MIVASLFVATNGSNCLVPDKHVPRCRCRPAVPEVGEQSVSDLGEQRQGEDAAGLGLRDRQHALPPVNGVEAELP